MIQFFKTMGWFALAVIEYIGAVVLLLLCLIGGITLYLPIYPLKGFKWVRWGTPFWWWFDDEDGYYGAEYWRTSKGITKKNIWVSYRWSGLRNPMWNATTKIKPRSGSDEILFSLGKLTRDGKEASILESACVMYEDHDGKFMGNNGFKFSRKYSFLGWAFLIFRRSGRIYWRFSLAKRLIGKKWIVLQFGAFYRYIFKIKFPKQK